MLRSILNKFSDSDYLGSPDKVLLFPLLAPAYRSRSLQVSQVVEFISELDKFGLIGNSFTDKY